MFVCPGSPVALVAALLLGLLLAAPGTQPAPVLPEHAALMQRRPPRGGGGGSSSLGLGTAFQIGTAPMMSRLEPGWVPLVVTTRGGSAQDPVVDLCKIDLRPYHEQPHTHPMFKVGPGAATTNALLCFVVWWLAAA